MVVCFEYYPYIQMWQYMLLCGIGAKPVAHLMQWEVVKRLMNSNMTLTVLNLHQKTPKGATTRIQVKRYKRYKRDIKKIYSIRYPHRDIKQHQICKIKGKIQVIP